MRKHMSLLLSLVLVAGMFGGCAKKTNEDANNASTSAQASQKEVTTKIIPGDETIPNAAKQRGNAKDTLVVGLPEAKGELLPHYSSTTYDMHLTQLIFDTLYTNNEKGEYVPSVAVSHEVTNENKTYTFKLKEGIKFSDGKPLTSKDIAFTLTSMCDPDYGGRALEYVDQIVGYKEYKEKKADTVTGIKTPDDFTIEVTFVSANVTNFGKIAGLQILPEHVYAFKKGSMQPIKDHMAKYNIIGSGRYKLVKFVPKQYAEFIVNENWFGGKVNIPNIIVKFTTVDNQFQELQTGNTDLQIQVAAKTEHESQIKEIGFLSTSVYPGNSYYYLGYNLRDERLADKSVRQALTYGFNRQQFIDLYYNGNGTVCNAPISQVSWAFTNEINPYDYNVEKANQLLEEAGWKMGADGIREKNGKKLAFVWDTYTDSKFVDTIIPMLKADWQKIGVKVDANLMEFNALVEKVYTKREFEIYNMGWGLSLDPSSRTIFHSEYDVPDGNNAGGCRNEKLDKLMVDAELEFDQAKRATLMHEFAKEINDYLPYMFIGQSDEWDLFNVRVKNFKTSPFCDWTYYIHQAELAQ